MRGRGSYITAYEWRSEDKMQDLVFSFQCVNLGDWTPVTWLVSQHLDMLRYLAGFFWFKFSKVACCNKTKISPKHFKFLLWILSFYIRFVWFTPCGLSLQNSLDKVLWQYSYWPDIDRTNYFKFIYLLIQFPENI